MRSLSFVAIWMDNEACERGVVTMSRIRVIFVAAAITLVVAFMAMAGCNSSSCGIAANTAPSNPYVGEWRIVAGAKDVTSSGGGTIVDADGKIEVTNSSIVISGNMGDGIIEISGKYDFTKDESITYKLENGAGYAAIGQSSFGPKPYGVQMTRPDGSAIVLIIENDDTYLDAHFIGRWRLVSAYTRNDSGLRTYDYEQAKQLLGGDLKFKFTPGGYAIMTYNGISTIDTYTCEGEWLTITDAIDGSQLKFGTHLTLLLHLNDAHYFFTSDD